MKINTKSIKIAMLAGLGTLVILTTGCVSKGTHEQTLAELGKTQNSLSSAQDRISEQSRTIDAQSKKMKSQQQEIQKNIEEISKTNSELLELEKNKKDLNQELTNSQALLNATEAQLETMRQIEAETKKRNEIYAHFVKELQKMIDGGQLTVSIEKGRIVINLPDNVLFATAQAKVNPEGEEALKQIATVLKEFSDRSFQIEGHTDNVPIKSARYPSNWELSASRALNVLHLMIQEGVDVKNVSAAGFGEFHPRADNETKEGKALNRRIEIIMLPNLDILSSELPKVVKQ